MPSYVTEGDQQVAAELDAQLNSSSTPTSTSTADAEWFDTYNKWWDASNRDKRHAVLSYDLRIDGSPVEIGRLFNALRGRSESSGGYNVPQLKLIVSKLESPGDRLRLSNSRQGLCQFIITKFVSVLG
jgi:hypothetical protein